MYRLDVVTIELPALRHRREDLRILVERFLRESRPDNVRELAHVIERVVLLGRGAQMWGTSYPHTS